MKPIIQISLDGKDYTAELNPYVIGIDFTDNDGLKESEADDVSLTLGDPRDFFRDNTPARGSVIQVKFGYEDAVRNAGTFIVDTTEYDHSQSGGTCKIKALAKDIGKTVQEVKTVGYESTSLNKIAGEIATRQGLKLVFEGSDISFNRQTQHKQRDLEYIQKLAKQYGYTCKVNNNTLVIKHLDVWLASGNTYTLTPEIITTFHISETSTGPQKVSTDYMDIDNKAVTTASESTKVKKSGSIEKQNVRVENIDQAKAISKSQATINSMSEKTGNLSCVGIPSLYAGSRIVISGYGRYDGQYYVSKVVHKLSRDGYACDLDFTTNPKAGS